MDSIFLANSSTYFEDWFKTFEQGKLLDLFLFFIFWAFCIPIIMIAAILSIVARFISIPDPLAETKRDNGVKKTGYRYTYRGPVVTGGITRVPPNVAKPWTEKVCKWDVPQELLDLVHSRVTVIKLKQEHIRRVPDEPANSPKDPQKREDGHG